VDITRWPMTKIMQLPDWCFGQRWPIVLSAVPAAVPAAFEQSRAALPERIVIWSVGVWCVGTFNESATITLALADVAPTTEAEWDVLTLVFPGAQVSGNPVYDFWVVSTSSIIVPSFRMPVQTSGRKLCARIATAGGTPGSAGISVVVSSIPTEVPDWLVAVKQGQVPGVT